METASTPDPTRAVEEPRRSSPIGRYVVLGLIAVFGVVLALRVKAAIEKKATIAAESAERAAKAAQPQAARPTELVSPTAAEWVPSFRLDGTLNPLRAVELAFKTGGRLGLIKVARGDRVAAGAVLAALDAVEARAQLEQAEAQVRAAEAQAALAKDAADRLTRVADQGVASAQSLVQARAQLALAEAQLAAARAQAKLAGSNVDNHTLSAPVAGLVVRAPNAPGAIVAPGVPMFRVEDTAVLQLDGSLGPEEAALVEPGAPVDVEIEGRTLRATLSLVLGSLDPATRRVAVAATLDNDPKVPVRPGAFVRARISGKRPISVLSLPSSALRPGSQDVVMVADGAVLRERRVVFSTSPDGALLVRRGLEPGERVARAPTPEARDGDPIVGAAP